MAKKSNSFHDWKDDSGSSRGNLLLFALIVLIVVAIGAGIYLNQDALLGNDDSGAKPTVESDVAALDENADQNVDEVSDEDTATDEDVLDTAADAPAEEDSAADTDMVSDDSADADDEAMTADFTAEDDDAALSDAEADTADDEDVEADEAAEEDDSEFAPSGNVQLIENVPMRDILSIYAYPNPSVKLFSVLENFAPHAAGRYENWVYVYYFYSEVVMDNDGETVLNRNNELRDGWVSRGRLQLTDAQFNSLRILNPERLPALPNIEYTEETALPFLGMREVGSNEEIPDAEAPEENPVEENTTE